LKIVKCGRKTWSPLSVQRSFKTDLVAKALGRDRGDLIADALVGVEVKSETRVVALNDDLGGLLDSL